MNWILSGGRLGRRLTVLCLTAVLGGWPLLWAAPARAADPEDTVREHLASISAQDFTHADQYFSAAFRRAFKSDVAAMDTYYRTRQTQLAAGFDVTAVDGLADMDEQTARVTIDFHDPDPDAPVQATERIHYYLIREKADAGAPLRDDDGRAWRIDIFDALSYPTLAAARRRPYLYTQEAWPEDEGRELRAEQGLYRIQQALESYRDEHGAYPAELSGGDDRRDELIRGKTFGSAYPTCGFSGRPMRAADFDERSSGDFSYFAIDTADGARQGYFLLLHGKVEGNFLFAGHDIVMLLGTGYNADQTALAREFAGWWRTQERSAALSPSVGLPQGWDETGATAPSEQPVVDAQPAPVGPPAQSAPPEAAPAPPDAPTPPAVPPPPEVLVIHSWGF